MIILVALSIALLCPALLHAKSCPPLGPPLPPIRKPSESAIIQDTLSTLKSNLGGQLARLNGTLVSIQLSSLHEEEPIFSVFSTPKHFNATGTHHVDEDTVFRIGSISKAFTVLTILLESDKIGWHDPVTKYIPQLKTTDDVNRIAQIKWEDVTVEALASQMAGINREFQSDIANIPGIPWTSLGLPKLKRSEIPSCGYLTGSAPCSRDEFFNGSALRHPVYPTWTTPIYSNEAFALLGLVLESVIDGPFDEYLQSHVLDPLGMSRTSLVKPENDSWGAIITQGQYSINSWGVDLGYENPAGSMYCTAADLQRFGRAIMQNKILPPVTSRRWLKPITRTSSLGVSVGAPWEIYHADRLTLDHRIIDFYTKGGALDEYLSILQMVPDYDLVLTVLVACGENGEFTELCDPTFLSTVVWDYVIPAFEAAQKEDARRRYAGYFRHESENSTASMSLYVDNGPGLRVGSFLSEGKDILGEYFLLNNPTGRVGNLVARLYPTGLKHEDGDGSKQESWRLVPEITYENSNDRFFIDSGCLTWLRVDGVVYGGNAFDDFIFHYKDDEPVALESRMLRSNMQKRVRVGSEECHVQDLALEELKSQQPLQKRWL